MIGAIAGNVIGSVHGPSTKKSATFPLFDPRCHFTADTVLTVATAWAILTDTPYGDAQRAFALRWPDAGYDPWFIDLVQLMSGDEEGCARVLIKWLESEGPCHERTGNGWAMRVLPIGWAFHSRGDVWRQARWSVMPPDHREGIEAAQATALAVLLARSGASKEEIRDGLSSHSSYDLRRSIDKVRDGDRGDVSCEGSVPEAIIAFLDSTDFEDAIRLAVSLGGETGTQAAIAGGIAEAFYGHVPARIALKVRNLLPAEFVDVIDRFDDRFM